MIHAGWSTKVDIHKQGTTNYQPTWSVWHALFLAKPIAFWGRLHTLGAAYVRHPSSPERPRNVKASLWHIDSRSNQHVTMLIWTNWNVERGMQNGPQRGWSEYSSMVIFLICDLLNGLQLYGQPCIRQWHWWVMVILFLSITEWRLSWIETYCFSLDTYIDLPSARHPQTSNL